MDNKIFQQLAKGDIVKHKNSDDRYVVIENYGERCTAVKVADMTNPSEWDLVLCATWFKNEHCVDG